MICRKCGHEWLLEPGPWPKNIDCPNCGKHHFKDGKYVGDKCSICGRRLTASTSLERGVGPVCWARLKRGELKG